MTFKVTGNSAVQQSTSNILWVSHPLPLFSPVPLPRYCRFILNRTHKGHIDHVTLWQIAKNFYQRQEKLMLDKN